MSNQLVAQSSVVNSSAVIVLVGVGPTTFAIPGFYVGTSKITALIRTVAAVPPVATLPKIVSITGTLTGASIEFLSVVGDTATYTLHWVNQKPFNAPVAGAAAVDTGAANFSVPV